MDQYKDPPLLEMTFPWRKQNKKAINYVVTGGDSTKKKNKAGLGDTEGW